MNRSSTIRMNVLVTVLPLRNLVRDWRLGVGGGTQLGVAAQHCHYDASKALQGVLGKGVGVHLQVQ